MSDLFPWEDIYEGNVFPTGIFEFEIEEIDTTNYSRNDKLMPKGRFRCKAPEQFKGMSYFDQYVVGTEENPTEVNAGTFGAKALKSIFKAAQVPKGSSLEELARASVGNSLLIQLNYYVEPAGEWKGREQNNVVGYYKIGERETGAMKAGGTASAVVKSAAKLPSAPKKKKEVKKASTIVCTVCEKAIPVAEYSAHIAECTGE